MPSTLKIHPAIGIARLGNHRSSGDAEAEFLITPEHPGGLPIECDGATGLPRRDACGAEVTTSSSRRGPSRSRRSRCRRRSARSSR